MIVCLLQLIHFSYLILLIFSFMLLLSFLVPSQPSNLRASEIGETTVTLVWNKPTHASDNIIAYDLYWNDTYDKVC